MQRILQTIGVLLLTVIPSFGALQFEGLWDLSGQGLGSVPTVLTVQQNSPNLKGCVGRVAGNTDDVFGQTFAAGGGCEGSAAQVHTQSQTVLFGALGFGTTNDPSDIALVYNSNQTSNSPITLEEITLRVYNPANQAIFTSVFSGPYTFNPTVPGGGSSGFVFRLDANDRTAFGLLTDRWNPANRFGVSVNTGCDASLRNCTGYYGNNDGWETIRIANIPAGSGNEIPEPATMMTMGTALIGLATLIRRRYAR